MEGAEDEAADAESSGYPSATEGTLVAPVTTIPTESVTHTIVKFGEVARIKNNNGGRLKCSDKVAVGLVLVTSAFLSWPL
jgi:hypothetical protein